MALLEDAQQTGNLAELDEAIELLGQAVVAIPPGHFYREMFLSNHGIALLAASTRRGYWPTSTQPQNCSNKPLPPRPLTTLGLPDVCPN